MAGCADELSSFSDRPPRRAALGLRTDTLADTVMVLLSLSIIQRMVGFVRAILFCRWLDADALGQWDMAQNFLMLAAPVSVVALSGSFPRYAEHYLQRRQLRSVLSRTALACALLAAGAAAMMHLAGPAFSRLVFGTPECTHLVAALAASLLGMVALNYFIDLFAALRNVRLMAGLHLLHSLGFAAFGIGLLVAWQCTALSVVIAYGASLALAAGGGAWWLARNWRAIPGDAAPPPHRELWSKLLPFAGWLWLSSMMANLFAIADRYMIIHYAPGTSSQVLAQVGEYHSSRLLPVLLISLTMMITSNVTAHLAHDWEAGRRERVAARLNLMLKLFGFALCAAAVGILLVAPPLFRGFFQGKFAEGLAVLPWTLTYCVWFAMLIVAQTYLICREKAFFSSVALCAGLVANVGLNLVLLPRLGLLGAVLATTVANLVALLAVVAFNRRLGFPLDRGACLTMALPLLFCLGPWVTAAVLIALVLKASNSDGLLSAAEKREFARKMAEYWARLRTLPLLARLARGRHAWKRAEFSPLPAGPEDDAQAAPE